MASVRAWIRNSSKATQGLERLRLRVRSFARYLQKSRVVLVRKRRNETQVAQDKSFGED